MSWYLYTMLLIQKTTAAAKATNGASGAYTRPTATINNKLALGFPINIPCESHIAGALTNKSRTRTLVAESTRECLEVCDQIVES